MTGIVCGIFYAKTKGGPMLAISDAELTPELGVVGDRYGLGKGSWSTPGKKHRQVSLITMEAIRAIDRKPQGAPRTIQPSETRRNIITSGIDLNQLVGKEFRIGDDVVLRGTKLCDPCERPAKLAGKPKFDFAKVFENKGGLCAEVIKGGRISDSDDIVELPEEVIRRCHMMVLRNGKVQECGGAIGSASIGRPFSPSSTRIGGPPEPPLFGYAHCQECGVMYVRGKSS
jgi:MOSC domain-containing protein YiiM